MRRGFRSWGQIIIPTSFQECLTYGQILQLCATKIQDLEERVKALEEKVDPETTVDEDNE